MSNLAPADAKTEGYAIVGLAPATPDEQEQHTRDDDSENRQRCGNVAVFARQTCRSGRLVVARAIGDIAEPTVRSLEPPAARHADTGATDKRN